MDPWHFLEVLSLPQIPPLLNQNLDPFFFLTLSLFWPKEKLISPTSFSTKHSHSVLETSQLCWSRTSAQADIVTATVSLVTEK
jgi:hypothetical protein